MSPEEHLNAIKSEIERLKVKRAKAENELENAEASRLKLLQEMQERFGVSTLEEAKSLLLSMRTELTQVMSETQTLLERLKNDS